jgi:hypothetical protein
MNILDDAKKIINSAITPTNITYGFVGITTAILSYYTFFENDIEKPLNETNEDQPVLVEQQIPQSVENQQMYGGKNKRKKNK